MYHEVLPLSWVHESGVGSAFEHRFVLQESLMYKYNLNERVKGEGFKDETFKFCLALSEAVMHDDQWTSTNGQYPKQNTIGVKMRAMQETGIVPHNVRRLPARKSIHI